MERTPTAGGGPAAGRVVAVNVGEVRTLRWRGRTVTTGIWKHPVDGAVTVGPAGAGLDGDQQADPQAHGGPDKAVYAYAGEDLAWWSAELGVELAPGTFGENLTVAGVDVTGAVVGERWRVGNAPRAANCPLKSCCSSSSSRIRSPATRRAAAPRALRGFVRRRRHHESLQALRRQQDQDHRPRRNSRFQ
jgi:hypothetical protein